MKFLAGLVFVALIIAGALWYTENDTSTPVPVPEVNKMSFMWNITELGEHSSAPGVPLSGVTITTGGKTYPIGTVDGNCAEIDGTSWPLYEGEKTGVICWWAGGGTEYGVFEEGGKMVVKEGFLEEGSAETAGFRGGFETIIVLE